MTTPSTPAPLARELHFTCQSGRVLLLDQPLTQEEREACATPEGMAVMEALADVIAHRCKHSITEDDPQYQAIIKAHGLSAPKPAARRN